jgi:hypothetical protein
MKNICPECQKDLNDSMICESCQLLLTKKYADSNWITAFISGDTFICEFYVANLNRSGIPAHILFQNDSMRPLTVGELAIIKIMVPEEFLDETKALIEEINKGIIQIEDNKFG